MAYETNSTESTNSVEDDHVCPNDASELVWIIMPDAPFEIWAWCCPECEYFEF